MADIEPATDDTRLRLMPRDRGILEMELRHAKETADAIIAEDPTIKANHGGKGSPLLRKTVAECLANEKLELAFYRKQLPVFLKVTAEKNEDGPPKFTVACACGRLCVTDETE